MTFANWLVGAAIVAVVIGLLIYPIQWCYHLWPRIWGEPRSAYDRMVYRYGARMFGLLTWGMMGVISPLYDGYQRGDWRWAAARTFWLAATMFAPLLWVGHWWGRAMAAFYGLQPPADEQD